MNLIEVFHSNFQKFLEETITQGYSIILNINANEDMRNSKLERIFKALGLHETLQLFTD